MFYFYVLKFYPRFNSSPVFPPLVVCLCRSLQLWLSPQFSPVMFHCPANITWHFAAQCFCRFSRFAATEVTVCVPWLVYTRWVLLTHLFPRHAFWSAPRHTSTVARENQVSTFHYTAAPPPHRAGDAPGQTSDGCVFAQGAGRGRWCVGAWSSEPKCDGVTRHRRAQSTSHISSHPRNYEISPRYHVLLWV